MTDLKLGALPPQRPYGLADLSTYHVGRCPDPPAAVSVPNVPDWRMFLNDTYGDCTVAGVAHAIMAWNAEVSAADAVPADGDVARAYFSLTGGPDAGLVEADVLQKWHTDGLFGQTIAGYAPVQPTDVAGLRQAIAFYGAAYLGVALPQSAQTQFPIRIWTPEPGSPVVGGHCIVAVGYSSSFVECVTWGQIVHVTYPWLAAYLTEVWAAIPHQFVEKGRGPVLAIDALQADLAAL